jgi:ribonuclease HII
MKRESLYNQIQAQALAWSVVLVDAAEIDRINILQATKQAMRQAIAGLSLTPDLLLIDAVELDRYE